MKKSVAAVGMSTLVGCGAPAAGPAAPHADGTAAPAPSAAKTDKQAQFDKENLDRLRALDVFSTAELIAGQPEETFSCYGPCSPLGKFVVAAEDAARRPAPAGACEKASIDANLAAIEALKIVHVGGLLVEQPKSSPSCYGQPCPGDQAAARDTTCARAGKLANIAAATKR